MFARVSTYELEQGRASEALEAFEPAIENIRGLDGFVDGFFLVERDGLQAVTVTLWESLDAMERSHVTASRARSASLTLRVIFFSMSPAWAGAFAPRKVERT